MRHNNYPALGKVRQHYWKVAGYFFYRESACLTFAL
jgi:hypothetical protein